MEQNLRRDLEKIYSDAGIFVTQHMSDQVIRGLITPGQLEEYPEIQFYFQRADLTAHSDVNASISNLVHELVVTGGTRLTFYYEPNDPSVPERIRYTRRALELIQTAGYDVPATNIYLPRHTRRIQIGPGQTHMTRRSGLSITLQKDLLDALAVFREPDTIIVSPAMAIPQDMDESFSDPYALYDHLEERAVGLLAHEFFHRMHFFASPGRYVDLHHTQLDGINDINSIKYVSPYASDHSDGNELHEFVAEYKTGEIFGKEYPAPVTARLNMISAAFGAPTPVRAPRLPAPLPLTSEKLNYLGVEVARVLSGKNLSIHVTPAMIRTLHEQLPPFERRSVLDTRAQIIAAGIESNQRRRQGGPQAGPMSGRPVAWSVTDPSGSNIGDLRSQGAVPAGSGVVAAMPPETPATWVRERTGPRPELSDGERIDPARLEQMVGKAVVEAGRWLEAEARRFPWGPLKDVQEVCLAQLRALADQLFPRGIASSATADDTVLPTEPSTRRLLERPDDWTPIPEWSLLFTRVKTLGVRGAGLVVEGRPGAIGHAFAIVNTTDGLYIADPQNGGITAAEHTKLRAPFQVRALLFAPTGQAVIMREPATPSPPTTTSITETAVPHSDGQATQSIIPPPAATRSRRTQSGTRQDTTSPRRRHIDIGPDGIAWSSSTWSAQSPDGVRHCVETAAITLPMARTSSDLPNAPS